MLLPDKRTKVGPTSKTVSDRNKICRNIGKETFRIYSENLPLMHLKIITRENNERNNGQ
jgi:transcriptional regulator of NAD metabolism